MSGVLFELQEWMVSLKNVIPALIIIDEDLHVVYIILQSQFRMVISRSIPVFRELPWADHLGYSQFHVQWSRTSDPIKFNFAILRQPK